MAEFTNAELSTNEKFVEEHTVAQAMVEKPKIFRVKDSDSLLKAFHKLQKNKILSLPVYDESKNRFFGFIDVLDIVNFVVKIAGAYKHNKKTTWVHFLETEELFNSATCGSVKNMSHHDLYTQVMPGANLTTAISLMTMFDSVHRLAVVGKYPRYDLQGLITQFDVVNYLSKNLDKSDPKFGQTLEQLRLGFRKVVSVPEHQHVADAFRLIKSHKVSGVAVVDADGLLVGNISASDVRLDKDFSVDSIVEFCWQPVLNIIKQRKEHAQQHNKPYPISVKPSATLQQVIDIIVTNRIHRVYIVDEHNKLQGVVSLSDILRVFHPRDTTKH